MLEQHLFLITFFLFLNSAFQNGPIDSKAFFSKTVVVADVFRTRAITLLSLWSGTNLVVKVVGNAFSQALEMLATVIISLSVKDD